MLLTGLATRSTIDTHKYDLRSGLDPNAVTKIIYDLSPDLHGRLTNSEDLSGAVTELLLGGSLLFEGPCITVIQVGTTAVKITVDDRTITEYGCLKYLEEHLPCFPAPRPQGLIETGGLYALFMSLMPGVTLEEAWPQLSVAGKCAVRDQLEELLSQLRSLPFQEGTPLGGVQGEGCKDRRRFEYNSTEPIMNVKQFEGFICAGFRAKTVSPLFTRLLRRLMPDEVSCVFTHGDLRPANIMVQMAEGGTCKVEGIIDWEAGGFYPAYWESVKATNNLAPSDHSDWYEHLPDSASPHRHGVSWLIDRLLDRHMDNN